MINRFNNIDSKEWLPYQKSWFKYTTDEDLYRKSIRFFMKFDSEEMDRNFFFWGNPEQDKIAKNCALEEAAHFYSGDKLTNANQLQFALLDVRGMMEQVVDEHSWQKLKAQILNLAAQLKNFTTAGFSALLSPTFKPKTNIFPWHGIWQKP